MSTDRKLQRDPEMERTVETELESFVTFTDSKITEADKKYLRSCMRICYSTAMVRAIEESITESRK